ncbi:uncharacterized protein LOC125942923 isoform X1 [Dermacentor silvarum]|uniref:uncharacterized protein LOC125942923 isoform X1 n=1 Tax=Dermacentor silvarum TaxID=543639 RepID=UPI0021018C12|nr:uncharacterized protein LOC125942923 isoform X1 [Dermacentor silvarum]
MTRKCGSFQENSCYWPTCCHGLPPQVVPVTSAAMTWKCTRTTPLECGQGPAEILQGRRLRNTLPDVGTGPDHAIMKRSQTNRPGGLLPPLETGATVRLRSKGAWTSKAKVLRSSGHPRSYDVTTEQGRLLRRNRRHLLLTSETFSPDLPEGNEDEAQSTTAKEGPMTLPLPGSSDAAPSTGIDASPIL